MTERSGASGTGMKRPSRSKGSVMEAQRAERRETRDELDEDPCSWP